MDVPTRRSGPQQNPFASLQHRKPRDRDRSSHNDSRQVPPSVATLLASTSIPRRTTFPKRSSSAQPFRPMSIDELMEQWRQPGFGESSSLPSGSPAMDMLLSPPDEPDAESLLEDDDSTGSPKRTLSSNSVPSLDDSSSQSGISLSGPSTPAVVARSARDRVVSSPRSLDVGTAHPLHEDPKEAEEIELPLPSMPQRQATTMARQPKAQKSLRSNLTASLQSLKSNISRTFANFAAPGATLPSDLLTKSFLGSAPYHPEMRPRPIEGTPDSRLRRYMNPHAFQPYDFHLHNHAIHDADLEVVAEANAAAAEARALGLVDSSAPSPDAIDAIPLEAMRWRGATSTEAGRAKGVPLSQARREPRENAEFLRIAVLELQMRRAGKTEGPPVGLGAGMGRRGWWLAPREVVASDAGADETATQRVSKVPRRWMGVSAEDF